RRYHIRTAKAAVADCEIQSRHYDLADVTSVAGSVPRRNARFFNSKKNTGTRMRTWIVEVTMPPTIGAAIAVGAQDRQGGPEITFNRPEHIGIVIHTKQNWFAP